MKTYCITCKKETDSLRKETVKAKNNRLIFRSVCKECKKNKCRYYNYSGGNIDIIVNYYHYYLKRTNFTWL